MISFFFITLGIILVGLSGIAEAVMDKLQFHYDISIFSKYTNQQYWNPNLSWTNKYKDDFVTPKFFGSTTFLVFLTDGWHFFKFVRTLLRFVGLIIIGFNSLTVWYVIIFTIIARIITGLLFQHFFKKIFNL